MLVLGDREVVVEVREGREERMCLVGWVVNALAEERSGKEILEMEDWESSQPD